MAHEGVPSVGSIGVDYNRSFGRIYENVAEVVNYQRTISEHISEIGHEAEQRGRRRFVIRAQVTKDFHPHAMAPEFDITRFIEATIPLSMIDPRNSDRIIYLAKNIYKSSVPEWGTFYDDWREYQPPETTPLQRVRKVCGSFDLVSQFSERDYDDLIEVWRPFGWTRVGVNELLVDRLRSGEQVWFAGVVDRSTNRLVSACMAEMGQVGNTTLIETTEYGTLPEYSGRKLATAAVSFLNAQILGDLYYSNPGRKRLEDIRLPLIYAELSLTSRSDIVARNAGYDIPQREGFRPDYPNQVLRHNVAVFDNQATNQLTLNDVDKKYHVSMGTEYPYYRNFVPGVLSLSSVERYYTLNKVQEILRLEGRSSQC